MMRPAVGLLGAALAATLAACASSSSPSTTTASPPATSPNGVPSLAGGPPTSYHSIVVVAGTRRAAVPTALAGGLAPLLIARDFGQQASLGDYGLDRPSATIVFDAPAGTFSIAIGASNFDRSGYYAMRSDRPNVYLVLAGAVRPVLALVGVS